MSNFAWWYLVVLIELNLPIHGLFTDWWYFKVTAVSNSFNWKFYVLIWLSLNFVWLLIASVRSWISNFYWFLLIFKGDYQHISSFDKKKPTFNVCFFSDNQSKIFQTLHDHNLPWGQHCHFRFDDLDFVSMSQVFQKY